MKFVRFVLKTISCLIGLFFWLVAFSVLVENKGVRTHGEFTSSIICTPLIGSFFLWLAFRKSKTAKAQSSISEPEVVAVTPANIGNTPTVVRSSQSENPPANTQGAAQYTAIKTTIVLGILLTAVVVVWIMTRAAFPDHGDINGTITGLLGLFLLIVLILATIGSNLGYKRRIVVYDSRADLKITVASIISWLCSGFAFYLSREDPDAVWIGRLLSLLSIILTTNSITRSSRANETVWNGILSVFAKYVVIVVLVVFAMIAYGGAAAAFDDAKKKRYKQAAADAAVAAVGAAGFVSVRQRIKALIAEPPPTDQSSK